MKITKLEPAFTPIQITIEDSYECDLLRCLFALTTTIPKIVKESYPDSFGDNDKRILANIMSQIHDELP